MRRVLRWTFHGLAALSLIACCTVTFGTLRAHLMMQQNLAALRQRYGTSVHVHDTYVGVDFLGRRMPPWVPIAVTAALPAAWLSLVLARRLLLPTMRKRLGLCPSCGYDLTGNVSGTCPECGTPVAAKGAA